MPKETFFNLPEDKRDRILEIAIDEFADNTYKSASISRIVARAGIAKGSFYQYFEDKKDLFLYLMELAAQEKVKFLQSQQAPDPEMGLFDYLRWLFEVGVSFQFRYPKLAKVGYRALYTDTPLFEDTLSRVEAVSAGYYRDLVELGIRQGDIDPGIDRELAAFMLSTLLSELGFFLMLRLETDPAELVGTMNLSLLEDERVRRTFDGFLHILQHGMGRRDGAGEASLRLVEYHDDQG